MDAPLQAPAPPVLDYAAPHRPARGFLRWLAAQPGWFVLLLGILLVGLVGYADWKSGPQLSLVFFYFVVICVVAWAGRRDIAIALAVIATLVSFVCDEFVPNLVTNLWLESWSVIMRGALLVGVALVLSYLKQLSQRLESMVQLRTAALEAKMAEHDRDRLALRDLAGQLSEAEDAERRRIAYDIHDALSQMLSVVRLNLDVAVHESPQPGPHRDRLTDLGKIVDDLIQQTRTLTFDLHPAMLDDLGLVPTLERYSEDFQRRTQTEVTLSEVGAGRRLDGAVGDYLFRAIKELLSNAVRHGRAKQIIIVAHWQTNSLRVVVDDDGAGFDPAAAPGPQAGRGLGLAGIRQRLAYLGGSLHIESQAGQGTRAILEVPLAV